MRPAIRTALENLSAAPEEQATYLEKLGVAPSCDELALELDDALLGEKGMSADVASLFDELVGLLDSMSGPEHAELWQVRSLRRPEWEKVRTVARRILEEDG